MLWLDALCCVPFWLRVIVVPETLRPQSYFARNLATTLNGTAGAYDAIRVLDGLASIRLLKLARYYEGAGLLVRSITKSVNQLLVPMFMLLLMTVCFSAVLFEIEWSPVRRAAYHHQETPHIRPS